MTGWANHGAWIRETRPDFGPGIKERFEWAEALDAGDVDATKKRYETIQTRIVKVEGRGTSYAFPPRPASHR